MTVHQMCLCGEKFVAPTIDAVWKLFLEHTEQKHGRSFPGVTAEWVPFNPRSARGRRQGGIS